MPLSDVTILLTSFLRHGYLVECIRRIKENIPEVQILVCDDSGNHLAATYGAECVLLPFDSGLPAKRNAGAAAVKTKFMLMGTDDFDFGTIEARNGVIKLLEVMEAFPKVDVAGGHFNNQPYEGFLDYVPGSHIKEHRLFPNPAPWQKLPMQPYFQVDLTVNYWMSRPELLAEIPQDERMKIGGEHGDWFFSLKAANKLVVWVPGVNINQMPYDLHMQHRDYNAYRSRAKNLGHQIFLQKRGIKNYYGFDEDVPKVRMVGRRGDGSTVTVGKRPEPPFKCPDPVPMSESAKPLIMVMCNHKNHDRVKAIRDTWKQGVNGIDVKFFFGSTSDPCRLQYPDEIFLDVPDDYNHLPLKVQAAFKWAHDNGYTNALKVDDDTYCVPKRLLTSGFEKHDWIGRINHQPDGYYCSGGSGYWLSAKAMKIVADATLNGDWAEDREIGRILRSAGIKPVNDQRYTLYPFAGETLTEFCTACMIFDNLPKNRFVQPVSMVEMHKSFIRLGKLPDVRY